MTIKSTLSILGMTALTSLSSADMFQLKVTNFGPQPLSPVYFAAGDATFDIFQVGGTASLGIKDIAESGNTANMFALSMAAGSSVQSFGALAGGPLMPGDVRTATFEADSARRFFSFASMLGMTNDGWIGESVSTQGFDLFAGPIDFTVTGQRAWDAGTELNTQDAVDVAALGGSGNPLDSNAAIRIHDTIAPGFGDSWASLPDWTLGTNLARIEVQAVPEPGTLTLLGLGAMAVIRRRRNG